MNKSVRLKLKTPLRTVQAFTLIEILIVIALTAVLFALLFIPLISALRYTKQAQLVTAAQDAARVTKERISRELSSAVFVFDGTSHPFQLASGTPGPGDDKYTNFLDLQILNNVGAPIVAHAYNAKLDFVLAKLNAAGAAIDPTTNEPVAYNQSQNGSAIISNPSYVFPLAAGTTMIRYFVGLKDPTILYNNTREGKTVTSIDNTYVLYRAQFQPYVKNSAGTGVTPNLHLFATRANSSGTLIPELDDPDFFRYVSQSDTNWLDDAHGKYPAQVNPSLVKDGSVVAPEVNPDGLPDQHNYRVEQWAQISKTVIPGPNVDLILLPHKADNTLDFDTATETFPGVAHSGVAHDPVVDKDYPIINTSVTFRPATVSGNATPGTTSDYNSQGAVAADQNGFTYIPTVYTATSQSWSLPYHVTLYPGNYGQTGPTPAATAALAMYYDTDQVVPVTPISVTVSTPPTVNALSINPGDIIEYRNDSGGRTPVYDVTQGFAFKVTGTTYSTYTAQDVPQYVPMTINPDNGTIMFAAPSLPNGPSDRFNRKWIYTPNADGIVDLTQSGYTDVAATNTNPNFSPLTNGTNPSNATSTVVTGVVNAHIVPGSLRVFGPDQSSGPNTGQTISYTEVNAAVGSVSDNQFSVDYATNTLRFLGGFASPVQVIYDYQANMTLTNPPAAQPIDLTSNPYLPMQVKVDYQTRDLIDVSIGVRIYDVTNNRAQVLPRKPRSRSVTATDKAFLDKAYSGHASDTNNDVHT